MSMDDIKAGLHTALYDKWKCRPEYSYTAMQQGTQNLYRCKCAVKRFHIETSGEAKSKKEAQTEAATRMGTELVKRQLLEDGDLPMLEISDESKQPLAIDDIKMALYAALGKKMQRQPEYQYEAQNDGRQSFICTCTVKELDFVAKAEAQQKKVAQTEAAAKMATWLVQNGLLEQSDMPMLHVVEQ